MISSLLQVGLSHPAEICARSGAAKRPFQSSQKRP